MCVGGLGYLTMDLVQGSQGAHADQGVILQSIGAGSPTSLASLLDPCLKGKTIKLSGEFQIHTSKSKTVQISNLKQTCKNIVMYCSLYII